MFASRTSTARKERLDQLEALLNRNPLSIMEAAKELGYGESTTRHYMASLHDLGRVYIIEYRVDEYTKTKIFMAGSSPDVNRPERAKEKGTPIASDDVKMQRNPLDIALFGEYKKVA